MSIDTNRHFEQAAQNLYNEIEYQGLSTEVIRQFLNQFAVHVISNVVPNDLLQSSNMKSIEQIVQEMRDMS